MTLQLRCTHSLSLCWLCQIFCNPVSKFQTILHQPHHECFNSQRRSEKRDWAIANKEKISGIPPSPERISTRLLLGIKLAFKEKQSTLDSVVTLAVRDAVDSVLIPALRKQREDIKATNNSVKELREEFEAMAAAAKQTRDRIDSVQATAREDRNAVMDLRNQLKRLTEKMTDMEDKSRKNNVPPLFFFFFWRGLMESRFHYNNVLVIWAFWEARSALKLIGHGSSQVFVAQSDLCSR